MGRRDLLLRASHSHRRPSPRHLLTALFISAIVITNYAVFFRGEEVDGPTLDQRLALPVPVEETQALPTEVKANTNERVRTEEGVLMKGETPSQLLLRLGASPKSASQALEALGHLVNLRALKVGQKVLMDLSDEGNIISLRFPLDLTSYVEVRRGDEGFIAERKEVPTQKEVVQFACLIKGSLHSSLERCGVTGDLAQLLVDLLEGQIDFFTDVRRGDVIRVSVEKESLDGKFLRYGRVLGLLYEGKVVTASAFPYGDGDKLAYYDLEGRSVEKPFLRAPLKYTRISSEYSLRRLHPILHAYTPHKAIDYAAPRGTPVYAVGDGKVIFMGRKGPAGRMVVLQHEDGLQTYYAHLDTFAKGLKVGAEVKKGTFIGTVGSSGRATGPHLHFAVAKNGRFVHPRTLLTYAGPSLPPHVLPEFRASAAKMVGVLRSLAVRGADGSQS